MTKNLSELALIYIKQAQDRVINKNIYPENIYTFFNRNFRKIEGWDTDWYSNFNNWRRMIESHGFSWQRWERDTTHHFSTPFDFEYYYNTDLQTDEIRKRMKQPICDMGIIYKFDPKYCSQLALEDKYE